MELLRSSYSGLGNKVKKSMRYVVLNVTICENVVFSSVVCSRFKLSEYLASGHNPICDVRVIKE